MQASAQIDTHKVPTLISEAVVESGQDKSSIIVVVMPTKEFYISRNAAEHRSRARNHAEQLRRLQWSVEETCKFASAEVVVLPSRK